MENNKYTLVAENEADLKAKKISIESPIGKGLVGKSVGDIAEIDYSSIPDADLILGGFPCQDYSVATTLKNSKGLIGKKGVLWWSIYSILKKKGHLKYLKQDLIYYF